MTSYKSIKTDVANAGAEWEDSEVVVDQGVITSRNPGDLEAFSKKIIEEVQRRPALAAHRGLSGVGRHNRIMASTRIAETDRRPPMGLVKRHYVPAVFPPAARALRATQDFQAPNSTT